MNVPTTWEDAIDKAALIVLLRSHTIGAGGGLSGSYDHPSLVPTLLDRYEVVFDGGGSTWQSWADMACAAMDLIDAAAQGGAWDFVTLDDVILLCCRKQHDYGHDNIDRFGLHGVLVRAHDKVARFKNLLKRQEGERAVALNEPLLDTLIDIVGYSLIAIMLQRNWFSLPLAADLKAAS